MDINVPYFYFMDTITLSEFCPIIGHDTLIQFNIVYDTTRTISVLYRPSSLNGSTRSIVFFGSGYELYKYSEAHIFYISNFNDDALIHSVLLKFHELLGISFCKLIGHDVYGYTLLAFNALFEELAPWTLTMIINLHLKTDLTLDLSKIKAKQEKGTHVFTVVQNRLDKLQYNKVFSIQDILKENRIQGWSFETPASTFYNDSQINHHLVRLDKSALFEFIDHIGIGSKNNSAIYKLFREF